MITQQSAQLVIDLLRDLVPPNLLSDPDLVIAGGAALSLYMADRILSGLQPSERSIMLRHLRSFPVMKFSDIDCWILAGSASPNKSLFDGTLIDKVREQKYIPDPYEVKSPYYSVYALRRQIPIDLKCGGSLHATKASQWAITYQYGPNPRQRSKDIKILPIQCIIKPQESVEALLNSFDLGICSVAIHRGQFYIHDSLLSSLQDNELSYNSGSETFKNKSFASRVFQSIRFLKYHDKTGFDFSDEVYHDVLNTMIDASTVYAEAQKTGFKDGQQIQVCSSGSNYTQFATTKSSILRMISEIAPQFQSKMMGMKYHQEQDALFLTDSEQFPLKTIIDWDKPAPASATAITNPCREIDLGELLAEL